MSIENLVIPGVITVALIFMAALGGVAWYSRDR